MTKIASYNELKKLRDDYAARTFIRMKDAVTGNPSITVSMDNCGIEAGAPAVLDALLKELQDQGLFHIPVMNSKCMGHCSLEPLICINEPDGKSSIYVQLTPEKARRIVREHLIGGKICLDLLLPQLAPLGA